MEAQKEAYLTQDDSEGLSWIKFQIPEGGKGVPVAGQKGGAEMLNSKMCRIVGWKFHMEE